MRRIAPLPRSNLVRLLKFLGSLILLIRMRYGVRRFCAPVWHHRLKTAWDCFFPQGVVGLGVIRGVHASASLKLATNLTKPASRNDIRGVHASASLKQQANSSLHLTTSS